MQRRDFLKMAAAVGAASVVPFPPARAVAGSYVGSPFQVPLRIPPVMTPRRSAGRDYYEVVMRKARAQLLPDVKTPVWGFDGHFPGPTIKAKRGREVVVRRINRLRVPTTIHLHGGRVTPENDGQPMDLVRPGEHKDYVYPNEQAAATLWYHDHTHHHSSRNNYKGLSGLYIIEDDDEAELNLPKGRFDIPLVLQDRTFNGDGTLRFNYHHDAVLGKTLLVNGRPTPYLKVANRKYRFRILNASHTRGYRLILKPGLPMSQIASDGGLLPAPYVTPMVELWPAERAEVVVDFSAVPVGTKIELHDSDPDDPTVSRPVMRFDVAREEADDSSLPGTLRPIEPLLTGSVERHFDLSFDENQRRWEINGKPFDPKRIDARPRLGDTEVWTFRNLSSMTHPMHIHLVQFQILSRSNAEITPGELGWKDTVRVDPSATVRVGMRFDGYTGRYMFHCHNLAHEDHSMMGQMLVTKG